ncbi:MAG: N-acetylmuramoyl-L-alanine amidase-like domain-containing protein [Thiotrichales bacterium]
MSKNRTGPCRNGARGIWLSLVVGFALLPSGVVLATAEQSFHDAWRLARQYNRDRAAAVLAIARAWEQTRYDAGTLQSNPGELNLIVRFDRLDCWTLVELATAVVWSAENTAQPDYSDFLARLRALRYRDGRVAGYGSRLHYFSEWLDQSERLGLLADHTAALGGETYSKPIGFMTRDRAHYPALADPATLATVRNAEAALSGIQRSFIPKARVAEIEPELRDGDLVAITSTRPGLDIAHQGLIVRRGERAYLLHASSEFGRVLVSRWPLAEYLNRNRSQGGIVVARWRVES